MSHRTFVRRITLAAALGASIIAAMGATAEAASRPQCYEDAPCWTWSTMGDLERGAILKVRASRADCVRTFTRHDNRVVCVLDPCGFASADHRGRIDWKRTARLKGDSFARRHGCNPRLYG